MDRVSDMITRINNGQKRGCLTVDVLPSRFCQSILDCLTREGFLRGYQDCGDSLKVYLKYKGFKPVIEECQRISRQRNRVYFTKEQLQKRFLNNELIVFTGSKGVFLNSLDITSGGEALFKIK